MRWLLVLVAFAAVACGGAKRVTVQVDGRPVVVRPGATLGSLQLRPPRGDLLAVDGSVLRAAVVPGSLLLNGRSAPATATLSNGAKITLVRGSSRREPLARSRVKLPHGQLPDPQFFLTRTPGTQVIVRGAISHKLVSARFIPAGAPAAERAVALTFDDGPGPYTLAILRALKRLHAPATFFLIGFQADLYPKLVRAEVAAGMTVGNHTYNHPEVPPFDQLPTRLLVDEISLGADSARQAGADPQLFRPPAGSVSAGVIDAARQEGERVVLWSVDPRDWQAGATPASITRAVLAAVKPGSIVELHDGGGDRTATLRALPGIVKGIRKRHLRLVAIPTG